ncbi:XkdF-like putative serine protease domain-containing protein [Bacillus paranthracis]|uniref:XkdF-like putative serine protease domain-containing protein n=1 Tax=Bacillus paranthracis TaxID=2026186 RepID=UPI00254FBB88|nr:XkdF-like putative serine protease domain-containing protein [Bacillus paranthracis]MDK7418668.1 XkdF-like putative serine protease domain-containing protein [Bacillus paranthracis]MDK7430209.1 XkdF-like putative serine protease domain-containing protein [Bacillus paranthracis]MDK7518984.1 XkdF-like putative serine protease domain-containing protein [Bacillus paranthracis]MDK7571801.1 XkdF-like putative serine protease domain-containing protein [Bacillus paranthracis]
MKKRKLKNLQVSHVSYVNAGANKREFFLTKSDEKPNFEKEVRVIKSEDDEKRLVYGVVYEPNITDSHNDFADETTIEKAAHEFMLKYRQIDKDHDFQAGVGEVVESYIAPADMEVNGETITKGTWVLVTKATEEVWEAIKKQEYKGYSLAGVAETEVIEEEVMKTEEKQMKSFFQLMKGFFSGENVQKGEVRDKFNQNKHRRDVNASFSALEDTFYQSLWNAPTADAIDLDRIETAALEFVEIINELKGTEAVVKAWENKPVISLAVEVEKAGKKISNTNMADIDAAIESLTNLKTRVTPSQEGAGSEEDNMNQEQVEKLLKGLEEMQGEMATIKKHLNIEPEKTPEQKMNEKVENLEKQLEELKKSQGISNQQDTDGATNVQKSAGGYAGYFGNQGGN